MLQLLLSLDGRVSRLVFWMMQVVLGGLCLWEMESGSPVATIMLLLFIWPAIAISIKRCHDRNKSGLWILLALVPGVGQLWALIELGFMKGTQGSNDYGDDPLAG